MLKTRMADLATKKLQIAIGGKNLLSATSADKRKKGPAGGREVGGGATGSPSASSASEVEKLQAALKYVTTARVLLVVGLLEEDVERFYAEDSLSELDDQVCVMMRYA